MSAHDGISTDTWIESVRAADAEAETAYGMLNNMGAAVDTDHPQVIAALIAIAAELRAARIARRPGAKQDYVPGGSS